MFIKKFENKIDAKAKWILNVRKKGERRDLTIVHIIVYNIRTK